jgi:8-oxo-dGTP pyrophosphatase MutT (NUDIX family)
MPPESPIKPWPTVSSRPLANYRIFQLRSDLKVNPRTGSQHDFFVIECVDWVNVVAVTRTGQVVMIEQFRHGSNTVELEIPGGMMDPHEADPIAAGQRELREETGYAGTAAKLVGTIFPNPAIQSNRCHTLLVEHCELKHATEFDHGEDIAVRLVPAAEIPRLIADGHIRHALVVVALTHFLLHSGSAA